MSINDWKTITLGNLLTLEYGASLPESSRSGGNYLVFGSNGVVGHHGHYLVETPGIIVGRKGSVGAVSWSDKPFWPIDTTYYVTLAVGNNLRWCYWLLQSLELRKLDSSTGVPGLNRNDVYKLVVPLPSADEQIEIAKILDTANETIANTEALVAKLRAFKQGMSHDLLTRGLDSNGQLRDPKTHPEQFRESLIGKIPKDWDTPYIGDLATYIGSGITPLGGSNVYQKEGVLFIRSQNVTFEGLQLDDVAFINTQIHSAMARSRIFPHDVLLNITGASIGRCCPMPDGLGTANVNQHVCAIRIAKPRREDAIYLSAVLASFIGQRQISLLNAGSNRQGLNYQQLRSFVIPWPNRDEEREAIAHKFDECCASIGAEEAYLSKLEAVKKGLMQDLLTGRMRVKAVEVLTETKR